MYAKWKCYFLFQCFAPTFRTSHLGSPGCSRRLKSTLHSGFFCEFQGKTTLIWAQNISPLGFFPPLIFIPAVSGSRFVIAKNSKTNKNNNKITIAKKKKQKTHGSGAVLKNLWSWASGSKLTRQRTASMSAGSIFKSHSHSSNSFHPTLFS